MSTYYVSESAMVREATLQHTICYSNWLLRRQRARETDRQTDRQTDREREREEEETGIRQSCY